MQQKCTVSTNLVRRPWHELRHYVYIVFKLKIHFGLNWKSLYSLSLTDFVTMLQYYVVLNDNRTTCFEMLTKTKSFLLKNSFGPSHATLTILGFFAFKFRKPMGAFYESIFFHSRFPRTFHDNYLL